MTLAIVFALAGLGIYLVAREMGYERACRDIDALLAAREQSVVAREARKRCQPGRYR